MGKRKGEQAGNGTVRGVLEKRSIVPRKRGLARYVLGTELCSRCANATAATLNVLLVQRLRCRESRYSFGAVATGCSSRCRGRTEKNLCRQGAQRNAWIPSKRPTVEVTPVMRSAEMRCNSKLPQIPQCAYKSVRNGNKRE